MSAAQRLMGEAFWAIVIKDGVDVRNVTHLGRRVKAHQRTALEARGGVCEFCRSTFRVEGPDPPDEPDQGDLFTLAD